MPPITVRAEERGRLSAGVVQVHLVNLGQKGVPEEVLDASERVRAARFLDPSARRRFVQSRVALRHLLARYLGLEPEHVPILLGRNGKPHLGPPYHDLHFNLSHADDFGLFAFVQGYPVGVDLERVQPMPDLEGVAARFFDREEQAALRRLTAPGTPDAFFRVWARREAVLKALGLGLGGAAAVSVSVADSPGDWLIRADESRRMEEPQRAYRPQRADESQLTHGAQREVCPAVSWLTRDLQVLPGHAAALAVPGGAGLRVSVHAGPV